jgi:hypothetical protein
MFRVCKIYYPTSEENIQGDFSNNFHNIKKISNEWKLCVYYPQWLLFNERNFLKNVCTFESWNEPEYDFKLSWNFENLFEKFQLFLYRYSLRRRDSTTSYETIFFH